MNKACVLVFAGLDPSGGAGIQADIQAISDAGAHPLPIITALTVQDNQHVHAVHPVATSILVDQVNTLIAHGTVIDAIKIGIVGSLANAQAIANAITILRKLNPTLPVVLDPVLASGHGDVLTQGDAVQAIAPLRAFATIIVPNLPEARALCDGNDQLASQAKRLLQDSPNAMIKGGHGEGDEIINTWFHGNHQREWRWPRLSGDYHGSGCTLASAIAARLAQGLIMDAALDAAQNYTQYSLANAYAIAAGQLIPNRLKEMS
ncbi:MAG: hydroxymethylpyrimidine/phosphomethylpyrimidine kinase [Sulfuritalea sp.]|nr:hydroxymethylpyrimidine/phosphomethylpyrimidine kinase [Polynucleobacter sp.]MCF8189172.1 hydroxymethylpyrimidine/phosphomethylpyrimidine kinase [Sulfuritalea sp.]